jgi:hypothetical protein
MGDYSQTTWVENVTKVGPTNMQKIEQGIADATKQVSADVGSAFDGSAATTNDKKRVVWRRTSNGSYVASTETYESGSGASQLTVNRDRVNNGIAAQNTLSDGAKLQRIIEAYSEGGNPLITQAMRLVLETIRGGRAAMRAEVKAQTSGSDPTFSATILDDTDYSDFERAPFVTTIPTTNLYDGKVISYLPDATNQPGVVWRLKYRVAESGTYKWYCVGGSEITYNKLASAGFDTITSLLASGYANLPTTGTAAKVTCPVAGDYMVRIAALGDTPADGQQTYMSFTVGATAANDDWAIRWRSGNLQSNANQFRINGVAAGADLRIQAKVTTTGGRIQECAISARPIRVIG